MALGPEEVKNQLVGAFKESAEFQLVNEGSVNFDNTPLKTLYAHAAEATGHEPVATAKLEEHQTPSVAEQTASFDLA